MRRQRRGTLALPVATPRRLDERIPFAEASHACRGRGRTPNESFPSRHRCWRPGSGRSRRRGSRQLPLAWLQTGSGGAQEPWRFRCRARSSARRSASPVRCWIDVGEGRVLCVPGVATVRQPPFRSGWSVLGGYSRERGGSRTSRFPECPTRRHLSRPRGIPDMSMPTAAAILRARVSGFLASSMASTCSRWWV